MTNIKNDINDLGFGESVSISLSAPKPAMPESVMVRVVELDEMVDATDMCSPERTRLNDEIERLCEPYDLDLEFITGE